MFLTFLLLFQSCVKYIEGFTRSHCYGRGSKEVEKVVALANAFKSSLTDEQKTLQPAWSKADVAKWTNFSQAFSPPQRAGISFKTKVPKRKAVHHQGRERFEDRGEAANHCQGPIDHEYIQRKGLGFHLIFGNPIGPDSTKFVSTAYRPATADYGFALSTRFHER